MNRSASSVIGGADMSDIASRGYANADALVSTAWVAKTRQRRWRTYRRIKRGPVALSVRAHPRRGRNRLGRGPQRSASPRLPRPRRFRELDVFKGHLQRHDSRALRRPKQLVGPATRCGFSNSSGMPTRASWDGGRMKWEAEGRELTREEPERCGGELQRAGARRLAGGAHSVTTSWRTSTLLAR